MKVKVFAVYDTKAQCFGVPFFLMTVGMAVRAFTTMVNEPGNQAAKYPNDYILYEVGEYEDHSAELVSHKQPIHLGMGSEFVEKPIMSSALVGLPPKDGG